MALFLNLKKIRNSEIIWFQYFGQSVNVASSPVADDQLK